MNKELIQKFLNKACYDGYKIALIDILELNHD